MMATTFFMFSDRLRAEAVRRLESAGFLCTLKNQGGWLLDVEHDPQDELEVYAVVFVGEGDQVPSSIAPEEADMDS